MGLLGEYDSASAPQVRDLVSKGHLLVDVRGHGEWAKEHVDGAIHIPLGELDERMSELPEGTPIVTMCHSGIRSAIAARKLARRGFAVTNLRGGMIAWNRLD